MTLSLFNEKLFTSLKEVSGKKLLVAFSAGKDSLALLDALSSLSGALGITLGACYINHGLRESAKKDECFCQAFCKEYKIPLIIENISSDILHVNGNSFEALARKFRYKKLCEVAIKYGYSHLLTAHTKNDAIETFFLDLLQGVAIDTLEGIRRSVIMNGIIVLRPMLEIGTEEVEAYLRERKLIPCYDETNSDLKYKRNLIRHRVMPIIEENIPNAYKNIIKLQIESALMAEYLDRNIEAKLENALISREDFISIDLSKFERLELLEKRRLLSRLFSSIFRLSSNLIDNSLELIKTTGSRRIDLPNDYLLERSYNFIYIFKKYFLTEVQILKKEDDENIIFTMGLYKYSVEFKNNLKRSRLILRNRRSGDKLGKKRIKDLFINKKIDLFKRDTSLIIEDERGIIFIEGILQNNNILLKKYLN